MPCVTRRPQRTWPIGWPAWSPKPGWLATLLCLDVFAEERNRDNRRGKIAADDCNAGGCGRFIIQPNVYPLAIVAAPLRWLLTAVVASTLSREAHAIDRYLGRHYLAFELRVIALDRVDLAREWIQPQAIADRHE